MPPVEVIFLLGVKKIFSRVCSKTLPAWPFYLTGALDIP
jgi:hypothetical protein